ncbi:unnamed protein product [Calypogeia fissa]
MAKVMMEVSQERDGSYVLDVNVAGELFRGRNSNLQGQGGSVQVAAGLSASHVPWNRGTDLQSVKIQCGATGRVSKLCDGHPISVRVVDRRQRRCSGERSQNEVDSEIEEDGRRISQREN